MTKITIKEVVIDYFKGVRNLHLTFSEDITRIYGANGSGKTTIMDAFLWLLFGKNSAGDSKFAIKTLDSDGQVIPNVPHRVQFVLSITKDGTTESRIFEKRYIEKRVSRRGRITDEVENTVEYYIDGESYSKTEYDIKIRSIVGEDTFRSVTSPMFFPSLHWKEQRAFLEKMANADYSPVTTNERYADITTRSQFSSVEEYVKHLSTNIKLCKEKIDYIPNKIEGINMVRPAKEDWDAIEADIKKYESWLTEINDTRIALEKGNDSAKLSAIRSKIEFCNRRIDEMVRGARGLANRYATEFDNKKRELTNRLYEEKSNNINLSNKRHSLSQLVERLLENIKTFNARKVELLQEYQTLKREYASHKSQTPVCPTCGRAFEDQEQIANANAQWLSIWQSKANRVKKENTELNEKLADAQSQMASYKTESDSIVIDYTAIKQLESEIASLKAPKSYEEILAENPNYSACKAELEELNAQLSSGEVVTDNSEIIGEYKERAQLANEKLTLLRASLAKKPVYEDCIKNVADLEAERDTLASQLDELLSRRDLAEEYQAECDKVLEDSVNALFKFTRFRLFERLNDGTRKPYCVATHNGVAYSDLNSAMRINCGLDILNAISRYYDVLAPTFVDNAETVTDVEPVSGQQILLYVSESEPTPCVK